MRTRCAPLETGNTVEYRTNPHRFVGQLTYLECARCGHRSAYGDVVLDTGRRVLGEGLVPACWNITRCAARRISAYGSARAQLWGPHYPARVALP